MTNFLSTSFLLHFDKNVHLANVAMRYLAASFSFIVSKCCKKFGVFLRTKYLPQTANTQIIENL